MASKMINKLLEGNAKFAAGYTPPPPLMKLREMWRSQGGAQGVVVGMLICID